MAVLSTKVMWNSNLQKINNLTSKPENFLTVQNKLAEEFRHITKEYYDFSKEVEETKSKDALPELIVTDFDDEQIWQQLELQNEEKYTSFIPKIAKLLAAKGKLHGLFLQPTKKDHKNVAVEDSDTDHTEGQSKELHRKKKQKAKKTLKKSSVEPTEVDDKFFKLREMEQFLEQQERGGKEEKPDETIDLFADDSSTDDDEAEDPDDEEGRSFGFHYKDFFDPVEGEEIPDKNNSDSEDSLSDEINSEVEPDDRNDEEVSTDNEINVDKRETFEGTSSSSEESGEEEGEAEGPKSSFESRQARLAERIEQVHAEALGEKPWQLKGEITATSRPQNSLLQETLEFDMTTRPAPVITEKTTLKLEDIIKQRIRDKAWDDVERKIKPVEEPAEYKKKLVLDQEKSKLSLAEVYEQDYLRQQAKAQVAADPLKEQEEEKEPAEHLEINKLMHSLFTKLDALSNYHYTPKPPAPEVKVVSNIPAITMEEVAPVSASDATLLAPKEVKSSNRGDLLSAAERSATDKKRQLRKKKKKQHDRRIAQEHKTAELQKNNPELAAKLDKKHADKILEKASKTGSIKKMENSSTGKSAVKSSTAFFSQLQDEVSSHIQSKVAKRKSEKRNDLSIKRLKL